MALVTKNDIKQIFADQAPSIDKPASFANYPRGWDASRPNNGKPTIKQFNYLQQRTDQNFLWIHQNGAALPYDATMEYAEGAVVVKDGELQQYKNGAWIAVESTSATAQSIADLRQLTPKNKGQIANLVSANLDQNEGGGTFIATQKTGLVDDGGLVVASPDPLIFWVRINYDFVTPEMFGAVGNSSTIDDAVALQKAFLHAKPLILAAKNYHTSLPIYYQTNKRVNGAGELDTIITKTTTNKLSLGDRTINGKVMNFDVDAVLIAIPRSTDWYAQNNHFDGFKLTRLSSLGKIGIGLYAPLICLSTYKNIDIANADRGIKSVDSWMVTWERVQASANTPWTFGSTDTNWSPNNTSQTFTSCWAREATNLGWDINAMQYSTMISCGADFIGQEGVPAQALFKFVNSDIVMVDCGCENIHAYKLLLSLSSKVKLINYNGQGIHNRYKLVSTSWNNANALFNVINNSDVAIEGGRFDIRYNSTSPTYGADCSALAYVEGNSSFIWDDFVKVVADIEEVLNTGVMSWSKFGVYYQSTTGIRFRTRTNFYEIKNATPAGEAKELTSATDTHKTFRNLDSTAFQLSTEDLNAVRASKGVSTLEQGTAANATSARNYPRGGNSYIIQQFGGGASNSRVAQLAFESWSGGGELYYRSAEWGASSPLAWRKIYHTGNTTVDANGFVKAASPIVKLFADRIELNDEAKQQYITFEKLGIGDYLIEGSSGLSKDGWYIETPKDANGNVLFSVIYATLENGDISVKTYKKKFDTEKASIVADLEQQIDINEGRWIDIRLNE